MPSMPTAQRGIHVHHQEGLTPEVIHYPEANSQTFVAGALLVQSSGQFTAYTQDSDAQVLAIAGRDANNDTNNDGLLGWLWTPGTFFQMPLSQTNSENTATSATTDVGRILGVNIDDSGFGFVDKGDTTTANLRARVLSLVDAAGTIAGRAIVQPVLIA